jgi:hypothetical protein
MDFVADASLRPRPLERLKPLGGARLRLRVRLRRGRLTRTLAAGAPAVGSRELAARAAELTGMRLRRALARSLEQMVAEASGSRAVFSSRAPLALRQVHAARGSLLDLACRLRAGGPVHARGVARTLLLITDATGPLYVSSGDGALRAAAAEAAAALDPALE